jgi:hypothetical protein
LSRHSVLFALRYLPASDADRYRQEEQPRSKKNNFARWLYSAFLGSGSPVKFIPLFLREGVYDKNAFALLYFAFSLSFFQREGCPWDRVSLYWQSLKDEKGNLSYTPREELEGLRRCIFLT